MSWVIVATLVIGAVGASQQRKASQKEEIEVEKQADQEKLDAEGREIERRQKLNRLLAANVVNQAASGISGEGTPESIALANAKQSSASEGLASLSDRLKASQRKRQATNIGRAGDTAAASTLLKSFTQAGSLS